MAWWLVRRLGDGGGSRLVGSLGHYGSGVAAGDDSWVVRWNGRGGAAGTVAVTVRQGLLDALGRANGLELALDLISRGIRPSRIDLVAVAAGGALRPRALLGEWRGRRARTRVRAGKLYEELDGRQGLLIGSRSSDLYGRFYEPTLDILRLETESKGARAAALGIALAEGRDPSDLWAAEVRRLIDFPWLAEWGSLVATSSQLPV